jgi:hypothetical protein
MKLISRILSYLLVFSVLAGCATVPNYRSNPQLSEKLDTTKRIVLIPLKTDVYQLTAGGVKEKMDEWTLQAKRNVMTAIQEELKIKPMLFTKPFEESLLSVENQNNLYETSALYDAVSSSIMFHTYGLPEHRFQEKITNFDYSLGPEIKELAGDVDAVLFVSCVDHIASAGRKALQTGGIILSALLGANVGPPMGVTTISIALVDANSGFILWYNMHSSGGDHDLRDPINTTTLVKNLLEDLPI